MNEQEIRALVRATIEARRSGVPPDIPTMMRQQHASHALFVLPAGADADGPCLIEPAVLCNHCGYCKSYGH